jgi:DNA-directed RNA polymerase specialized sigma24 family protein
MERPSDPKRQELVARIEAIVRRMPRLTRDIFLAHRAQGMTCAEIARRTGLTVRQVERHLARALVMLDRGLHREARPWWQFW